MYFTQTNAITKIAVPELIKIGVTCQTGQQFLDKVNDELSNYAEPIDRKDESSVLQEFVTFFRATDNSKPTTTTTTNQSVKPVSTNQTITTMNNEIQFPEAVTYFIGTKKDGSKVSIKLDKKGVIEQVGVTATGAPIESVRALKPSRVLFYENDWKKYVSDQCNLQSILSADVASTKEYRDKYTTAKFGSQVERIKAMAIDGAEAAIDEIRTVKSANVIENRVLSSLEKSLSKPAKAKKAKPEVIGKDGLTPSQRKAIKDAAEQAKVNALANLGLTIIDGKATAATA